MIENYYFVKVKSKIAYSLQLIFYACIVQVIILYVPLIVQMVEQQVEEQANTLVAYRVVANSTYIKDERIKQQFVAKQSINDWEFQENAQNMGVSYRIVDGKQLLPPKWVNNRFYPQNYYVVHAAILGNGRGDNWFCAMFQHVCIQEKKRMKFSLWKWLKNLQ